VTAVQLLTIPQVMQRLGIKSKDTIYKLISDRELRVVDISTYGRSRSRVREDDLAEFIEKRTRVAAQRSA
jgi:excisionase family DNA binding protein